MAQASQYQQIARLQSIHASGGIEVELSAKDLWTVVHGMLFGAIFLLAFAGAAADLYAMNPAWETVRGVSKNSWRLIFGLWTMAVVAWATVISGTWFVYIWYRAKPVPGVDLRRFPRYFLLSKESTHGWHEFGMEWKEHVAWLAPIILTSLAYCAYYYGPTLANSTRMRKYIFALLGVAFFAAAVAGAFGAFINKVAPTQ